MSDEQTWTFLERPVALWGPGPWQDEPDRIQWTSPTGFVCLILRIVGKDESRIGHPGHFCGYVGIPKDHPWNGSEFDEYSIDVHGGITGGGPCQLPFTGQHEMNRRCHASEHGADDITWLGFDCHHSLIDLEPGEKPRAWHRGKPPVYRDVAYVKQQCEQLAQQARAAADAQLQEDGSL